MAIYTIKHNDAIFDKIIIEYFQKYQSIQATLFELKHQHGIIVSREEVSKLIKTYDLGNLITKKGRKKNG